MISRLVLSRGRYTRRIVNVSPRYVQSQALSLSPFVSAGRGEGQHNANSEDGASGRFLFLTVASSILLATSGIVGNSRSVSHCERHPLNSTFVADAVEIAAPAVVNIMSYVDGFLVGGISSGSGFIITDDGLVVTNAHVVMSSTDGKVLVTAMNGKKRTGIIHSLDTASDIALVQLDNDYAGEKYPTVALGTSGKVRNGEFVIALGSPMQLQNSCSFGIVSATARHASELGFTNNRAEFIQTDAAINAGNSGGPLINLHGQVIGINSMKAKGADGISFAIPIDTAAQVIHQLRMHKRVIRPYVGLNMVNFLPSHGAQSQGPKPNVESKGWWGQKKEKVRDAVKEQLFNTQTVQVLVQSVTKDSPADKCGIQM